MSHVSIELTLVSNLGGYCYKSELTLKVCSSSFFAPGYFSNLFTIFSAEDKSTPFSHASLKALRFNNAQAILSYNDGSLGEWTSGPRA